MAAKFDLNDDTVVVIIGSGAGGGTLGISLVLDGVDVEPGGAGDLAIVSPDIVAMAA